MEIITLSAENLEREHICCAISNADDCQVTSKKAWLAERFTDGLTFKKGNVRGKCFIEYIPAENAWAPIVAPGYMHINCLWVSGQFKGHGYSDQLLEECIRDSREKGKLGLTSISSVKKQGFLADPKYLAYKGFIPSDTAAPGYVLYYLPFDGEQPAPRFAQQVKDPHTEGRGFELFYSHQCPFTAKYVPIIEEIAARRGAPFRSVLFESAQQAQNAPSVCTSYCLFYDGKFLTHEILSDKKFDKLLVERGY